MGRATSAHRRDVDGYGAARAAPHADHARSDRAGMANRERRSLPQLPGDKRRVLWLDVSAARARSRRAKRVGDGCCATGGLAQDTLEVWRVGSRKALFG